MSRSNSLFANKVKGNTLDLTHEDLNDFTSQTDLQHALHKHPQVSTLILKDCGLNDNEVDVYLLILRIVLQQSLKL